jgi:ABC-type lipoprotein export system ATPase subunit
MTIARLTLSDFTAFRAADLKFASGLNVFIGANATGKTHVMKVLYATLKAAEPQLSASGLDVRLKEKLARVFRPDDLQISRLGHRRPGQRSAKVSVVDSAGKAIDYSFYTKTSEVTIAKQTMVRPPSSIFLPSREALAMYEGFIAAYQARELSFDETYFDLAVALSAAGARGPKPGAINSVLRELEEEIGGSVVLDGPRFYVNRIEAHLLSEGMRKLASIVRLLANNELREKGVLFWDEPEANLNPRLAVVTANVLARLATHGIQIFVATHDYLVSETLGLSAKQEGGPPTRFFSFSRTADDVSIEEAESLDDLQTNLIREEFLRHYDRVRSAD